MRLRNITGSREIIADSSYVIHNPKEYKGAMKELFENGLIENVKKNGAYMTEQLKKLQQKHSCITDVRGIGFIQGIALNIPTSDVINKCIEMGLLLVGAGHDVIRFVPALIAEQRHIDEMITILDKALTVCENV